MAHTTRCERSASDPRRCRCECGGAGHGEQATPIDLGDKRLLYPELGDDLKRAGAQRALALQLQRGTVV